MIKEKRGMGNKITINNMKQASYSIKVRALKLNIRHRTHDCHDCCHYNRLYCTIVCYSILYRTCGSFVPFFLRIIGWDGGIASSLGITAFRGNVYSKTLQIELERDREREKIRGKERQREREREREKERERE